MNRAASRVLVIERGDGARRRVDEVVEVSRANSNEPALIGNILLVKRNSGARNRGNKVIRKVRGRVVQGDLRSTRSARNESGRTRGQAEQLSDLLVVHTRQGHTHFTGKRLTNVKLSHRFVEVRDETVCDQEVIQRDKSLRECRLVAHDLRTRSVVAGRTLPRDDPLSLFTKLNRLHIVVLDEDIFLHESLENFTSEESQVIGTGIAR